MEKIIYSSRIKTFCWALFFLAIIYGNFLMLNDNNITDTFFRLTLVLGMLLSCCIFLLFLYLTIIRTPMCIINESGITIGGIITTFIPWQDVSYVIIPEDKHTVLCVMVDKTHFFVSSRVSDITKNTKQELYQILEQYTSVIMDNDK